MSNSTNRLPGLNPHTSMRLLKEYVFSYFDLFVIMDGTGNSGFLDPVHFSLPLLLSLMEFRFILPCTKQ